MSSMMSLRTEPGVVVGLASSEPAETHLVCMFCVTAGQNGESLGSDEQPIVQMVFLLYDVINNKVSAVQKYFVRPVADEISETKLTSDCKAQTGLDDDDILNAQPLENVLEEFERFLKAKEIHPQHGGRPFCLCTDGPLHLRLSLHPEAFRKNIPLPPHLYRYYDIRKSFRQFYKVDKPIISTLDMLESCDRCVASLATQHLLFEHGEHELIIPRVPLLITNDLTVDIGNLTVLGIEPDSNKEFGIRHSQNMAKIINRLITDGYQFRVPEIIIDKLESGICIKTESIDDETVVKARGLPWQSSDQDIFNFFRGLNVTKGGVAVCLSQQGRRNGEAMVRFESREHRMLALRKHKHHLGQRYIEVYRATGKDFLQVAGSSREAQLFLSRQSMGGGQVIVRMRGLPYTARSEQVIEFFKSGEPSVEVLDGEEGVLFVHQADGRATGDAFVLFATEAEAAAALTKHKLLMGTRYIELFKSTTAEVQQVLNRSMDPRNPALESMKDLQSFKLAHLLHPMSAMSVPLQTLLRPLPPTAAMPPIITPQHLQQQQTILSGTGRADCIRLRGLPAEAQVNDIVTFLDRYSRDIVNQGVHLIYTSEGLPSGEAFIQMISEEAAQGAMIFKNHKMIYVGNKRRSVEVIQCSGDSLSSLFAGGMTPPTHSLPPISMQHLATSSPVGVNQWVGLPQLVQPQLQKAVQQPVTLLSAAGQTVYPQILPLVDTCNDVKPAIQDRTLVPFNSSSQLLLDQPAAQQLQPVSCILPVSAATAAGTAGTLPVHQQLIGAIPAQQQLVGAMQTQQQLLGTVPAPHQQLIAISSQPLVNNSGSVLQSHAAPFPAVPTNAAITQPGYLPLTGAGGSAQPFTTGLPSNGAAGQYVALQPVVYWASPTPPISPHSPYYVQPSPVSVLVKGLPPTIQASDILSFLNGLYEIQPDVQVQRGADGRPTGSAIVTFATRSEADRAVAERNKKMLGNRLIELHAT